MNPQSTTAENGEFGINSKPMTEKSAQPEPTAQWMNVTPAMAKDWLENKMPVNRNLSTDNLKSIASDMNRDNFPQTGDSIKFCWNGNLLDGQHRLQGIVSSGKMQRLLVVTGLDPEVFTYLDLGRKRNAADALSIEGVESASKIAAMIKFIINYKRGKFLAMVKGTQQDKRYRLTNRDVVDFMREHQESIQESYPYGHGAGNRDKVLSGSNMSGLHYIFKTLTPDAGRDADYFFHALAIGSDLAKDSPIFLLRQRLITDLRSKKKMPPLEKVALVIKAWNAYRQNRKIKALTWSSVQEAFPKPV